MAYSIMNRIGAQPIADTSTTQQAPLGTKVIGVDPTYGEGEFIYLLGVASTIVGAVVTYNATTYQTTLHVSTQLAKPGPVAIAMSANVASQYGWYQIRGMVPIKKTAVAVSPAVIVYISATAGRIKALVSTGTQLHGIMTANLTTVVTSTSTVVCNIMYPHVEGAVA